MTHDISRSAHDPKKHYASALFQQGRIPLDDDLNESDTITKEDERLTRIDVIGPAGSPDGGFRMVASGSTVKIQPGTMYVGGLRVVLEQEEDYNAQVDAMSSHLDELPKGKPGLVYLEVWQQVVTAVEDTELLEPALGGPDTTARLRTMHRIRCLPVTSTDCAGAWGEFEQLWRPGEFDPQSGEVKTSATLAADFDPTGTTQNPCSPGVKAGYLGAENQTIRVQITQENPPLFLWGFDNASSLYRVEKIESVVESGTTRTRLTIPSPKDEEHWPRTGQTIELLGVAARLPSNDPIAELDGPVLPVFRGYDPVTRTFELDVDPTGQLVGDLFVRVWNQGDANDGERPIAKKTPTKLGNTGVLVTFDGDEFRRGDHWILGVRPDTDHVIPRDLFQKPRGPNGVRRFYAPLGIVDIGTNGAVTSVHDCRPTFDPLTTRSGCCTYTVGGDKGGAGHFATIQEAVNNLPTDGGEICILAGDYTENVTIPGLSKVTVHGCGDRTVLHPADPTLPALSIAGDHIAISRMKIEALSDSGTAPAILVAPSFDATATERAFYQRAAMADAISLCDLSLHIRGGGGVVALGCSNLRVFRVGILIDSLPKEIQEAPDLGATPGIFVLGDDILLEQNRIEFTDPRDGAHHALGGIQIGSGSSRVEMRRNVITAGRGNGITLGHIEDDSAPAAQATVQMYLFKIDVHIPYVKSDDGCCTQWGDIPRGGTNGNPPSVFAGGSLEDVRIIDNDITLMGKSGISVAALFPPLDAASANMVFGKAFSTDAALAADYSGTIEVDGIVIENNRIRDCLQLRFGQTSSDAPYFAIGGIILADASDVTIRDNFIEDNGRSHDTPACGIFIGLGDNVSIDRNRIVANGPTRPRTWSQYRGGIVVSTVAGALDIITSYMDIQHYITLGKDTAVPPEVMTRTAVALRVHDNVVSSPYGAALDVVSHGPVDVQGNDFTSQSLAGERVIAEAEVMLYGGGSSSNVWSRRYQLGGAVVSIRSNPHVAFTIAEVNVEQLRDQAHTETRRPTSSYVTFDDNAVSYASSAAAAAPDNLVYVAADDDVSFQNNRIVNTSRVVSDGATAYAISKFGMRFNGNRISEGGGQLSATVIAPQNVTTNNVTNHCIEYIGLPTTVFTNNVMPASCADDGAEPSRLWLDTGLLTLHLLGN